MVWINEFHYDNDGTDSGEFIEIAGAAGTDLTGWSVVLYNGTNPSSAATYGTIPLSGTIVDQANGFGFFGFNGPGSGIQNGTNDGFALVDPDGNVVQFLSYEGVITASNGPASGMTSIDVGVEQGSSTPAGSSLQLTGTGDAFADFTWASTDKNTSGAINTGQTFEAENGPGTVSVADVSLAEGDSGTQIMTFTVTRSNAESAFTLDYATKDGTATTADGDYVATKGTLDFSGSELSQTVSVTINGDAGVEPDEAFTLELSNLQSMADPAPQLVTGSATGTIENDDFDDSNTTLISTIQGEGDASEMVGDTVTVEAIVVGDFQQGDEALTVGGPSSGSAGATFVDNAFEPRDQNGFYLQQVDENGNPIDADNNPLTSEGIFVYEGSGNFLTDVKVGDRVRVTGQVAEFNGTTEIDATDVSVTAPGAVADVATLATAIDLTTTGAVEDGAGGYVADLERYEGMLVTIPETMTITEQFNLDRYNEIRLFGTEGFEQQGAEGTLIEGERPFQFTQYNAPDAQDYDAYRQQIAAREIVYDDGQTPQNLSIENLDGLEGYDTATAPRMGDTVTGLTGVLRYDFNEYRILGIEDGANEFERGNGNPEPTSITAMEGDLKVASFNVLNFFTTLDDGSGNIANGQAPRGANSEAEYERQLDKLVVAIQALDSDIVGLIEIENQFQEVGGRAPAIQTLVDALNASDGPGVWAYVDPGQPHIGGDAIAVGSIYRTDTVRIAEGTGPNGQAVAILDDGSPETMAVMQANGASAVFEGPGTNRVPLAVTFQGIDAEGAAVGEELTVVVNHFKSKGSAGPATGDADAGDGAGASNQTRLNAAEAITAWLDNNPTGSTTENKLIIGDLNSYASEDPIQHLLDSGFVDLAAEFLQNPYGYIFDGLVGTLDYMLASGEMFDDVASLADKIEDFVIGNINADEADALDYNLDFGRDPSYFDGQTPVRASDHDPLVASFSLGADQQPGNYTLQLLHMSDGEAGLLAGDTAPIMGALIDRFEDDFANTLILSGGDNYIPGPFLNAGSDPSLNAVVGATAPARPDIAIHNAFGVEASAIGNHEFDLGSPVFAGAIAASGAWDGALFPHVSANLDFSGDASLNPLVVAAGQDASEISGRITPWTVVDKGGQQIGILGATTQELLGLSSPNGTTVVGNPTLDDMALLAAQLQPIIGDMQESGLNKIVLMSHLQDLDNERELATLLDGVDIILGAGSNTRLGDGTPPASEFPGHEANFADTYPVVVDDTTSGETTLIVNTDNEYTYLGRLAVEFDADGDLVKESLTDYAAINGAYASTQENLEAAYGADIVDAFAEGSKGDQVRDITEAVGAVIEAKDGVVYGFTDVYLEGERAFIRSQETNFGNLAADSQAFAAREAVGDETLLVSLKNGGGIRAQIGAIDPVTGEKIPPVANADADKPEGGVSQLDVENALRFDNKLMVFDTNPAGLLAILNHGVSAGAGQGRFPQIGGVEFSFDPDLAPGSRVQDVAVVDGQGNLIAAIADNGQVLADAPETISVVTLSFLAAGGDNYPQVGTNYRFLLDDGTLSEAVDPGTLAAPATPPANALGEQAAFERYLGEFHATPETAYDVADTPEAQDTRTQNLNVREDTVLEGYDPGTPGGPGDPGDPGTPGDPDAPVTSETNPDGSTMISVNTEEGASQLDDFATDDVDTVVTGFSVILPGGIENVTLTGIEDIDATGNALANLLIGNEGDNLLSGEAGNDLFQLGGGNDEIDGGLDVDTLVIDLPRSAFTLSAGPDGSVILSYEGGQARLTDVELLQTSEGLVLVSPPQPEGFNEAYYLAQNPDVAAAVEAGNFASGAEHFAAFGAAEGRAGSQPFDEAFYLRQNPDVAQAVEAGIFASGAEHFRQHGEAEGRNPVPLFDTDFYLAQNPDVAQAVEAGDTTAYDHYLEYGSAEGRAASLFFDGDDYYAANPDVAAAGSDPFGHLYRYGAAEGRIIGQGEFEIA